MFADDTNILGAGLNKLDGAIGVCEQWAIRNQMKLNKNKSKIMFADSNSKYNQWEKNREYKY